jgi:translation initiation factor IF-2
MTEEQKQTQVVEKRVKAGVIRRRKKKVEAPSEEPKLEEAVAAAGAAPAVAGEFPGEAAPVSADAVAPAATAEAPAGEVEGAAALATEGGTPAAEGRSAAEGPKMPSGQPVGRIELPKAAPPERKVGVVGHIEEIVPQVKEDWRERLKRGPKKRKSKAELEMEAIQRAGGLRHYAETVVEPEGMPTAPRAAVQDRVFRPTMTGKRRRPTRGDFKKTEITERKAIKKIIRIEESITVAELSRVMGVKGNELVRVLMDMGTMVTLNQPIDFENAQLLVGEYGFTVERSGIIEEDVLGEPEAHASAENLQPRAPVVTVMGHVDHGKTSILDLIRKTSVAAGEAGGITQHIGAYEVKIPKGNITFIDTPGHAAFTNMRARGAQVTDLVVLVVAAEDGVMPQTVEAIDHSKAAGVPIIVAINKIDKPDAQPDRVKQELTEHGLVTEEWGGDVICVSTSAITGQGIDDLLDMILLQAEMLDLKADPTIRPKGVVVEAKLDKGRGPVATVLVQEGTLDKGQFVVCGNFAGKVRAMQNADGDYLDSATPSMAVEIQGLSGVPAAGDEMVGVADERAGRSLIEQRRTKSRDEGLRGLAKVSLEDLAAMSGDLKELQVIIKSDVHGTAEAVADSLTKLSTEKVKLDVLHKGVGGITENDVLLAAASQAIVVGFNVSADSKAKKAAQEKKVDIRIYRIIYEMIDDVKNAMAGLLAPKEAEVVLGHAEVRDTFKVSKVGTIAGCYVIDGKIRRNARARLLRDQAIVFEGAISSLKRFKDDAKEVGENYECGIGIEGFNDIKNGDVIEAYIIEKSAATLE